jgi:MscS family membrane protein
MSGPDWIPESLRGIGPLGLAWWQWVGVLTLIGVAYVFRRVVVALLLWVMRSLVMRSKSTWDDELVHRLAGPARLLVMVGTVRIGLEWLALPWSAEQTTIDVLFAFLGVGLAWTAFAAVDIAIAHVSAAAWASDRPASRALLSIGGRIAKFLIVAIASIAFLGALGVPIASLVAGLGIGGIALAFGAQKTVENLFGAFSLGVDQPLREGDFVRIEDHALGTVEKVGLRSTQIRTLDRTVITLPNGRLSDMRIETFAVRDRVRLATSIGLVYSTKRSQLDEVLRGFESVLRSHPGIWQDTVVVKFAGFGPSSLDIEIMAWFETGDYDEFRGWRQEVLIGFIDVVERAGSSFAFPTQTIHVESLPAMNKRGAHHVQ